MKSGLLIVATVIFILPFILCEYSGNKYDPVSGGYIKPSCTIDTTNSTVKPNDTITADSALIYLIGTENFTTLFKWKLDSLEWSIWKQDNDGGNRIPDLPQKKCIRWR
jgi:hypothetical protein